MFDFEFSGKKNRIKKKKTYSRVFKNAAIGPQPITTIINATQSRSIAAVKKCGYWFDL